jgi:hypothetical protein
VDVNLGYGACPVTVCVPATCGAVNKSDDCRGNCCAQHIAKQLHATGEFDSDVGINCHTKDPPCIMSPSPDPCYTSATGAATVCARGARCGIARVVGEGQCGAPVALCECGAVGNYSGARCTIACATDRAPCGRGVGGYSGNDFDANTKCCSSSEVCLEVTGKYGWSTDCFPKVRPLTCSPNPCK